VGVIIIKSSLGKQYINVVLKVGDSFNMVNRTEIIRWLKETRDDVLEELWQKADQVRKNSVGDDVHLRGLIEISNYCSRQCHYCGIRAGNRDLERYRMTPDEIMASVHEAFSFGYGTVVLQAGEDPMIKKEWVSGLIRQIKKETPLAVTLSLGERSSEELIAWHEAGADRYLIRFETSNKELFSRIHPPFGGQPVINRIDLLKELRKLGYEVGSGVMIGIPGQSYDDLANDIELFATLDLDMIGVGPFIPHPSTPLGENNQSDMPKLDDDNQVPNTELMTYKVVALTRLVCPCSNIPSTTALATLNLAEGRELGLQRGANIVMPNLTPAKYRIFYEIYPAKACIRETAAQCHTCMKRRIESIGRKVGMGPGTAVSMQCRDISKKE
jgi:biotin synthase